MFGPVLYGGSDGPPRDQVRAIFFNFFLVRQSRKRVAEPQHVAESWPRAQLQVPQNSGSGMYMLRVKTQSRKITTDEIQERKNHRDSSNTKAQCQCTDGLSAKQNGRGTAESSSIPRKLNPCRPTQ